MDKLSDLKQDTNNANLGNERGQALIEESFKKYGAGRSILIDKHGNIIAGNKSALGAAAAGIEDIQIVQSDGKRVIAVQRMDLDINDPAARELAFIDNRAGEVSLTWNVEAIQTALADPNIKIDNLWTREELFAILPKPEKLADPDDVPDAPVNPISRPGDLYELDRHRLVCGDSTRRETYDLLLGKEKVEMVWTDPPYNVAYVGKTKDALEIQNDEMSEADFTQFMRAVYGHIAYALKPGGAAYIAHADTSGHIFRDEFLGAGLLLKQCLVWVKNIMVMGRQDYQWQHEPILYGWKPGAAHRWRSDRMQTTVLNFDRPNRSAEHPTMKPVALVQYMIHNSSLVGDLVLDPFGGSGTTLIACEMDGRDCRTIELDPKYVDVIVARWEKLTGKKAKLIRDGAVLAK